MFLCYKVPESLGWRLFDFLLILVMKSPLADQQNLGAHSGLLGRGGFCVQQLCRTRLELLRNTDNVFQPAYLWETRVKMWVFHSELRTGLQRCSHRCPALFHIGVGPRATGIPVGSEEHEEDAGSCSSPAAITPCSSWKSPAWDEMMEFTA